MVDWTDDVLGSYLNFRNGKTSPDRSEAGGFPVYGSNGSIGRANDSNAAPDTIIIGRVGTYCGSLHFSKSACWVTDNAIACSAPNQEGRFWFYALESLCLNNFRTGSGQPLLNQSILKKIRLRVPTRTERIQIGTLLGILDDKIDLNQRMNETLEAMAWAIFNDWFVDFGPTRAKVEGREPYLATELWDLFPDALDDKEKPERWDVRKLEDILELNYGKSLPARKRTPGNVAVYGSGGLTGTHDTALIEGPAVIVGRKGTVGSLYWEDGPVFPIDTVFYVVPRIGSVLFAYHLLASQPLPDMNTDAAVPGLNRNNVYRLEFSLPSPELISAFEFIGSALWQLRAKNLVETKTLAKTRDLLLPKLMSGEIRLANLSVSVP